MNALTLSATRRRTQDVAPTNGGLLSRAQLLTLRRALWAVTAALLCTVGVAAMTIFAGFAEPHMLGISVVTIGGGWLSMLRYLTLGRKGGMR